MPSWGMLSSSPNLGNHRSARLSIVIGLAAAVALGLLLAGEIRQDQSYHHFADRRGWSGLANFANVASNLPFLIVGVLGVLWAGASASGDGGRMERTYWRVLFAGTIGVSIGSSLYHLQPSDTWLVWDRLPMAITFMALLTLVVHRHIGPRAASRLFPVLQATAIASILVWRFGGQEDGGDLRLYAFVQFFPILVIPATLVLFPTDRKGTTYLVCAMLAYVAAKALEEWDEAVFQSLKIVSGHTLKHLVAAVGTWFLVLMMCAGGDQACGGRLGSGPANPQDS